MKKEKDLSKELIERNKNKRKSVIHYVEAIVWVTLIIASIIGLFLTYDDFKWNPFEQIVLQNTSAVAAESDGTIFVVSNSNRTVSKINDFSQLDYSLDGLSRETDRFYLVKEIETDGAGNAYILNAVLDVTGSFTETESIQMLDTEGNYLKTIYELKNTAISKLSIKGLKYIEGALHWSVLDANGIQLFSETQRAELAYLPFENASIMIQDVKPLSNRYVVYVSKDGRVYRYDVESKTTELIYAVKDADQGQQSNLWGLEVDENGSLYINDIGQFSIYKLEQGKLRPVFKRQIADSSREEVFFNFSISNGRIVAVNDGHVVAQLKNGPYEDMGALEPSLSILMSRLIVWIFVLMLVASFGFLSRWVYKGYIKNNPFKEFGKTLPILLSVLTAAILIAATAINYYGIILEKQAINNLKMLVQNSEYVLEGESIEMLKNPSDFYNDTYQKISEDLQKLVHFNKESWNENLYTALYTIRDERYYALVYNDNSVTPYYPFNVFTDNPDYDFFKNAYAGQITEGTEVDADGKWIFAMGPVYNQSGEVVAIVEVGMNKYIFDEWSAGIVKQIIIDVVSILIILILLVSEISFFTSWLKDRKSIHLGSQEVGLHLFNDLNILRTLALLTYVIIFMCTAFIPIMAKSIYSPIGQLPMTVTLGLPIFFEVFFTAVTILFAGVIAEKKGWRMIFYLGTSILVMSAVATALTRSLIVFIVIRSIAGIGNGFIQMTMYAFVNIDGSESKRNEAFAHMMSGAIAGTNLGIILGANLADKIGFFNVFFVMAGFGVTAILFERTFLRHYKTMEFTGETYDLEASNDEDSSGNEIASSEYEAGDKKETNNMLEGTLSWWIFFTRKEVWFFFLFILVPAFLCYMYLEYFFPIFAEANGVSTSVVGIVFSLYGLFIVYFGPSLSTYSEKYLGAKNATALASLLTGISLLVFALTGSLMGAVFAVLVLALSDSFGETVYTTYFLALKASKKIGKSIAAGYLEFVSQIGKMVGALAFGIAIGFGEQFGIGIIGLITTLMSIVFYLVYMRKPKVSQK